MIILHDRYHAIVVWAFFKERRSFLGYQIIFDPHIFDPHIFDPHIFDPAHF